ncbi:unnamed protein product [Diatraea saccharalis]|uniref:Uncharacterized protein n=1 Tax=Diatraea saccharalis TaxID=40085 RepID=A0A9P0CB97_9NEOP|nr:unnamed protein product [Diatraea saccharalis]
MFFLVINRNINRKIRAEELLRVSNYPGTMATRDRSRLSTPAAHSDLPIDPSPVNPSITSSDRQRSSSPVKRSLQRKISLLLVLNIIDKFSSLVPRIERRRK